MKSHGQRKKWQFLLFLTAVVIGIASLLYTNHLVKRLAAEEHKKAEIMADAWTQIVNAQNNDVDLNFYAGVIEDNETIPVIVTDTDGQILFTRNLDSTRLKRIKYVERKLKKMKENAEPIIISMSSDEQQYLYYDQSILLNRLFYYPYIQLGIVLLFIMIAYFAFQTSRRFEQNQVWVGMSKETAHQLGTPISSLLAWKEMMKMNNNSSDLLTELEKDINRLEKITERFSKIGSQPVLKGENIVNTIEFAVRYINARSSDKIQFTLQLPEEKVIIPLNAVLFEWVIENLCKNAIDAMHGEGKIEISLIQHQHTVSIDFRDTGKGIPKSMFKSIFRPGFTTKKKGWGLGLSLVKRIIEEYHNGKIFVHQSELNKGSVIRILLKR